MDHPVPDPPELGEQNGLAYALFVPPGAPPRGGVVILHGAGSSKESHFDFARACRAQGLAALSYDARGHGSSDGKWGSGVLDDVRVMSDELRRHAPVVALRGTSMGGFCAIHAAARDPEVFAVVAVCPAPEEGLARSLRSGSLPDFAVDVEGALRWLDTLDLRAAAQELAGRCFLLLMHAEGDEQVPYTVSAELHERAGDPKRLMLMPGGHHRSLQHDPEMQSASIQWIERALRAL